MDPKRSRASRYFRAPNPRFLFVHHARLTKRRRRKKPLLFQQSLSPSLPTTAAAHHAQKPRSKAPKPTDPPWRTATKPSSPPPPPPPAPAAEVEKAAPNGGVAGEEVTVADAVHPAKSYAAVAANAEIEDLRSTKLDLEEQLASAGQENKTLAAEAHRLEGLFSQARDDVATAEHAAATTEEEAASLRAEVERLKALLDRKKADREADERQRQQLTAEVETVRQAKLELEKEIDALKAATTVEDREAAPDAGVPKEERVAWQGMAAGAAAGAAITAAVVLIYLRLKR